MTKGPWREPLRLFTDGASRTTPPRRFVGTDYDRLSADDRASVGRVRALLEYLFDMLPDDASRTDAHARFTSGDPQNFYSAFWEMYLCAVLRQQQLIVTSHPPISESTRHPDFFVQDQRGQSFYMEAVVAGVPKFTRAELARLNDVNRFLDSVALAEFGIAVSAHTVGPSPLRASELASQIRKLAASSDPDAVISAAAGSRPTASVPDLRYVNNGWDMRISLVPEKVTARNARPHGNLVVWNPSVASKIDDVTPIKKVLRRKGLGYGRLDRPLVVALLYNADFFHEPDRDLVTALFGNWQPEGDDCVRLLPQSKTNEYRHDGVWRSRAGEPTVTRLSTVLFATDLHPWRLAEPRPSLWHNPWASHQLPSDLGLATWRLQGASMCRSGVERSAGELLALPGGWPHWEDDGPADDD